MVDLRGRDNVGDIFYTLSINFLLYVVLIIVFYMLVRFYLEEDTSHENVVVRSQQGYAKLATSDGDEVAEGAGLNMQQGEANCEGMDEALDEDVAQNAGRSLGGSKSEGASAAAGPFLDMNAWGDAEGTKQEVFQRLTVCAMGLVVTFSIWGLVQERILTQSYDGDFFEFSYGLVFMNRLGGLILSAILMVYFKVEWVSAPLWEYSFPSVANMLSSWCQYEALKYVSFPTQMLAKAFKLVPVMLMGMFMHNKSYESYEYVSAAMIGFGLYLFLDSSETIDFTENSIGEIGNMRGAMCGVVLLILFLFFDSFTGQWQTRMFKLNRDLSPVQMMLIMNAFSVTFSFITLVLQEELQAALLFVVNHKVMLIHLAVFCVCSTVGQLFIFYTVKSFGAVVFSIIMSARILFSTLLSCFWYDHPITELGFLGMTIVFGAIGYRINRLSAGKPLLRWRESEEAKSIMHEWHEHIDL